MCCVFLRVSVSRNFQDQEKMEEAETVHRQALQAGKQSPFSGELFNGLVCLWHCFIILYGCLWYLFFFTYFSTYSKNPAATPMGDVPRRLNECQVVTSRQTYSISIKIT